MPHNFKKIENEILKLNPWASDLWSSYIPDKYTFECKDPLWNREFQKKREIASVKRWQSGRDVWNRWAEQIEAYDKIFDFNKISRKDPDVDRAYLALWFLSKTEFYNYTFENTADFSGFILGVVKFAKRYRVDDQVKVITSKFHKDVIFDEACLSGVFDSVIFPGNTSFSQAKSHGLNFFKAQFLGETDFSKCHILGGADFSGVTFSGKAKFVGTQFESKADFYKTCFENDVDFTDASMWVDPGTEKSEVNFMGATFKKKAIFVRTSFENNVYFNSAHFQGEADFRDGKALAVFYFGASSEYPRTRFDKNTYFYGFKSFLGTSNFDNVDFNGDVDFREAEFLSGITIDGACFNGKSLGLPEK